MVEMAFFIPWSSPHLVGDCVSIFYQRLWTIASNVMVRLRCRLREHNPTMVVWPSMVHLTRLWPSPVCNHAN